MSARPHDLLWLRTAAHLQGTLPDWVSGQWRADMPLVVRRDTHPLGLIAVGVRGLQRGQRAAGWAAAEAVVRQVTPESLAQQASLLRSPFLARPPVQGALSLVQQHWDWAWGITGSCGYALATDRPVLHDDSDLDLVIRAPHAIAAAALLRWQRHLAELPCRADTQVETPYGAFALNEWLRDGRTLLKTSLGPRLTDNPWASA
ncbi:malonate decarboxylase holo-ACP synthase [Biostraticola tofi]|uniref:Phosphoribosyl-dephospho-CoA transferase n=1 Tax=Biostraticola tofi TaxID=466109 RepID=A0A4R3Z492_9GAMM|nr:malonate decarboxylase holo-ACP synthase [Biostraticola tofi]TCW00108.1 phosphoribosyl-dephospho-CoA transferase [Biostraticola tofi]